MGTVSNVIPSKGMESENPLGKLIEQRQAFHNYSLPRYIQGEPAQEITPREYDSMDQIGQVAPAGEVSLRYNAMHVTSLASSWI